MALEAFHDVLSLLIFSHIFYAFFNNHWWFFFLNVICKICPNPRLTQCKLDLTLFLGRHLHSPLRLSWPLRLVLVRHRVELARLLDLALRKGNVLDFGVGVGEGLLGKPDLVLLRVVDQVLGFRRQHRVFQQDLELAHFLHEVAHVEVLFDLPLPLLVQRNQFRSLVTLLVAAPKGARAEDASLVTGSEGYPFVLLYLLFLELRQVEVKLGLVVSLLEEAGVARAHQKPLFDGGHVEAEL